MSDLYNVLVIVSYGNTAQEISLLVEALRGALWEAVADGSLQRDSFHVRHRSHLCLIYQRWRLSRGKPYKAMGTNAS